MNDEKREVTDQRAAELVKVIAMAVRGSAEDIPASGGTIAEITATYFGQEFQIEVKIRSEPT